MSYRDKICPLMSSPSVIWCAGEQCAWWDRRTDMCFVSIGADCLKDVSNNINALNIILEGKQEDDAPEQAKP